MPITTRTGRKGPIGRMKGAPVYRVARIRVIRGNLVLVQWVGYKTPTWEPLSVMTEDVPEMIHEYQRTIKGRKALTNGRKALNNKINGHAVLNNATFTIAVANDEPATTIEPATSIEPWTNAGEVAKIRTKAKADCELNTGCTIM